MKSTTLALASACAAIFAVAAPAHAAISVGDMLDVQYLFPDASSVYEDSGSFAYTGPGQSILTQNGFSTVILDNNSVTFSQTPGCGAGCTESPAAFNGAVVFDLTNSSAFAGWTLLSDTVGLSSDILSGSEIGVNWQGAVLQGQAVIGVGAVPEPSAWAMMIAGFAMVGFALRRRSSVRVTYA
jgi:hypothetical protein